MKLQVLAVDNHPLMLKFFQNTVEKKDHDIVTADDGLSALSILSTLTPDVMFIDLVMPYIGGEKLLKIVNSRPNLSDVYTVVISGMDIDINEMGADAFIAKAAFGKMGEAVNTVLDHVAELKKNRQSSRNDKIIYDVQKSREALQVTRELFLSRRHLEAVFNHMSEAIIEMVKGSIIVTANKKAVEFIGITEENLLATNFLSHFSKSQQKKIRKLIHEAEKGDRINRNGITITMGDKFLNIKLFQVEMEYGKTLIAIMNDITESYIYEQKLKDRDNKLKLIIENLSDIYFITDRHFRIIFVNRSIYDLTGYDNEEIKLISFEDLFIPLSQSKLRSKNLSLTELKRMELCIKKKDGESIWTEITTTPICDYTDKFMGIVGIIRDIEDRKKEEKDRFYQEKLKGVLEMARAACHEIGQPLQIIKGNSELLKMDLEADEKPLEEIDIIMNQVGRIEIILNKLRRITKYVSMEYINGKLIVDLDKSS